MKTIEYRGRRYEVPDWVRFISTDEDGYMCGFENRPIMDGNEWWRGPNGGRVGIINAGCPDWRESLVELPE